MNKIPLFECNDKRIVDVMKLVRDGHNTKMNVFQRELDISYAQAVRYIRLLEVSGVYADSKHYKMITLPDGRLKRTYCPYEIIVSDEELAEVVAELEKHYEDD